MAETKQGMQQSHKIISLEVMTHTSSSKGFLLFWLDVLQVKNTVSLGGIDDNFTYIKHFYLS